MVKEKEDGMKEDRELKDTDASILPWYMVLRSRILHEYMTDTEDGGLRDRLSVRTSPGRRVR